ncbi:TadE family protein [Galactobacter caseinivorans]|uniref:Pilus assembly protein n=1 Tax=Galactobacter caseinivorans TaxID=2676123 RepID=A0A496PKI7_9MICC|nr:TadE/TadG family type IV pilus assembly protein [Galactobacter caseinivorans]RKW70998.1 pilus assembly protein [Galactobacter caseinivorans]
MNHPPARLTRTARRVAPADERGSAVAEFVFITALLMMLFLGTLQLAGFLHARNMAHDAAVHGARYAALADRSGEDGQRRAEELLTGSLGKSALAGVTVRETPTTGEADGSSRIQLEVEVRVPLFAIFYGPLSYTAQATATRYS